jgi:hypothetical protein
VKAQAGHAGSAPQPLPGEPERVGGDREHPFIHAGRGAHNLDGAR